MDLERQPVDEEDKNDKLGNEVAGRQLDSEDNGRDEGEIILRKPHVEIQSLLRTEEPGLLRDRNSECEQNTGEEISNAVKAEEDHITNTPLHDQPPLEQVADVTNSSAVNGSVPKSTDVMKVGSVSDKSNEKGTDDLQNSGDKTEMENMDVTFLETVNNSERAQANNNKGDENTICTETKQVKESENKVESIKPGSMKGTVKAPSTTQGEWMGLNVLLIRGLSPAQSGDLKHLLNTTLGVSCHRIEPRHRGDSVLRVHFRTKDDMDVARDLLHRQIFMGCRLTAVLENQQTQKRKAETMGEVKKPPAKKMKQDPVPLQVERAAYLSQIAKKSKDVYSKLTHVAKRLGDTYPIYDGLIRRRELENSGILCTLNKFKICPPKKRFANRCKFSLGTDAVTGQLIVGIRDASGAVNQVASVPHNFPPHVVEGAKVFEKAIRVCEQALEDPKGRCQYQFWHELIIYTNMARDLMMLVYVKCPEELAADRMTCLKKELKQFFENGEGKNCHVTSLYTRVTYTTAQVPEQRTLVMGSAHLEETVLGLKLQLLPTVHFWNNISAAKMVCKGVEEMLSLTKKISVVVVGFGLGLVGLHLSRFAGEVLSVVARAGITEAQKNAAYNDIKNVEYFGGNPVEALTEIAEKISFDKACAVMTCRGGAATMGVLRKISKVRRLVLVAEMSKACYKSITALCNPSKEHGLGNPFFPVRAIPVDTMPNEDGYVLMILMERIGLLSLPKSPGCLQSGSVLHCTEGGSNIPRVGGHLMPLAIEAKMKGGDQMKDSFHQGQREFPGWKKELKQSQRGEMWRSLRPSVGCGLEATASFRQHPMGGEFPCSSNQMLRVEEKNNFRELMAQEWKRQMEEEHVRLTEDEKHRRWAEKGQQRRQVGKEEHRKWIQEKEPRRYMAERELNREMNEREFQREIKEVGFQKYMEREREGELVGMNPNMRSRNALVQEVIADSLREAEISHLSAEASQKLKNLVAEAVRTVGVMDRGERHGVSTGSGVNRIIPEGTTNVRFERSDTALPQSRHFEDGYSQHIRESDNPYDHRYDAYGGAVERSDSKKIPQLRYFDEGYSHSNLEVDSQYQRGHSVFDGTVRRVGFQHDLEPQQSIYSTREGPVPRTGVDRAVSQPLRLSTPYCASSNDVSHLEGSNFNVRRVYFNDFSNSGNREQKASDLPDTFSRHGNFAAHRTRNEDQPSHMGQSLHTAVEQNTDRYVALHAQKWDSSAVNTNYIPLSSPMKQLAGSMPKPPGTEGVHRPEGSSYVYTQSAPRLNRFGMMMHHS